MEWVYKIWTELTWVEGFIFTLWLIGLYWGKKKLDYRFARKTQHAWDKSIYKVKIVEDSHITVDHAHIDEIDHAHIDDIGEIHGDVVTHPKKF